MSKKQDRIVVLRELIKNHIVSLNHHKTELNELLPIAIVCAECGSDDILLNASVRWDVKTQEYEVVNVYDRGHYCADCGSDSYTKEVPA